MPLRSDGQPARPGRRKVKVRRKPSPKPTPAPTGAGQAPGFRPKTQEGKRQQQTERKQLRKVRRKQDAPKRGKPAGVGGPANYPSTGKPIRREPSLYAKSHRISEAEQVRRNPQATDLENAIDAALLAVPVAKIPKAAKLLSGAVKGRKVRAIRVPKPRLPGRGEVGYRVSKAGAQAAPFAAPAAPVGWAIAEGHVTADPGKATKTTLRSIPGLVTAPIGGAANVALSGYRGTQNVAAKVAGKKAPYSSQEVTKPTTETAESVYTFGKELAETMGSGDPERIRKAVESEYGYTLPIMAAIPGGKLTKPLRDKIKVRPKVVQRRAARKRVAQRQARARVQGQTTGARAATPIIKEARKAQGARGVTSKAKVDPGDTVGVLAREGINLNDQTLARFQLSKVRTKIGPRPTTDYGRPTTHDALDFIDANPRVLTDPHLKNAVEAYKRQAPAVTTSERARLLPVASTHGVQLPEQRVPVEIRGLTQAKTRKEAEAEVFKTPKGRMGTEVKELHRLKRHAATKEHQGRVQRVRVEGRGRAMNSKILERFPEFVEARAALGQVRKQRTNLEKRRRNVIGQGFIGRPDLKRALETDRAYKTILLAEKTAKKNLSRVVSQIEKAAQEAVTAKAGKKKLTPVQRGVVRLGRAPERPAAKLEKLAGEAYEARTNAKGLEERIATKRSALRKPDEDALIQEFLRDIDETLEREGLVQPAWTFASDVRRAEPLGMEPSYPQAGRKVHRTTGYLQKSGLIDESLQALISGSVTRPRMRTAIHKGTDLFVENESRAVVIDGKRKKLVTRDEARQAALEGQFDPKTTSLFPLQQFKQAVVDDAVSAERLDAAIAEAKSVGDASRNIKAEVLERADDKGHKYVLVEREAGKEFVAQMEPVSDALRMAGHVTNTASRLILGTSPGWAVAQFVAEGAQAAAAVPRPVLIARAMKAAKKLPPEERAGWAALAGETPGVAIRAEDLQLSLRPETNTHMANAFRAMQRTLPGRLVHKTATLEWLGIIDKWKGARIREAVMGAHLQREFNGWAAGVKNLWREQDRLATKLEGLPLAEQMAYFARNTRDAERLTSYLDDVMGNWSALTRYERIAAPLSIFYPFIRMSLRYVLWSYPKRHPIKASIMLYLGQWNANEVSKMLGGDPAFFGGWADAPIRGGKDGEVTRSLPLARVAPGGNAYIEAFGEGAGAQTEKALSPGLASAITLLTGVDPLTGKRLEGQGSEQPKFKARAALALGQLLAMPTPLRVADQLRGPREFGALPVVGKRRDDTALGRLFKELAPAPQEKAARGALFPFLTESAPRKAEATNVSQILERMSRNKVEDREVAAAAGDPAKLAKLQRKQERYEKAKDDLAALIGRHHIGQKAEKEAISEAFKLVKPIGGKPKPDTRFKYRKPSTTGSANGGYKYRKTPTTGSDSGQYTYRKER